ncbi:MAG: thioredoxin family protein [Isosphaeraceae bacterium]
MSMRVKGILVAILLAAPSISSGQESPATPRKPARPSIYDVKADARDQIKAATALARRDARRVLVMFGGDWCGWCHKLHGLFASDSAIKDVLVNEYVLVMVDTEAPHAEELLARCRGDLEGVGYPFLAVLDGEGQVVTRQKTDPLEEGDHHDPAKVLAFLKTWAKPRADAAKVFADGLARASSEDKLVFLHFGAPTCGWCHKLDAFLAREDMAPIFGRAFVDLKLDLDRMTGAEAILGRYKGDGSGGIPWFAFLDAQGKALIDSDGPKGNVGYPVLPEEIAHFVAMLRKAAPSLTPADVEKVEAALKVEARKIEEARAARTR